MESVINILIIVVWELNIIMQISDIDLETNILNYTTRKENLCQVWLNNSDE